jgi:fatty acid desaturase
MNSYKAIEPKILPARVLSQLYAHPPWWQTLAQSAACVSTYLILGFASLRANSWLLWIPIWWTQAIILAGFLGAAHDCAHGTFAKSPAMNRVAGTLWASLGLFNFTLFKYYHREHHRYTTLPGDTEPGGRFSSVWEYLTAPKTILFFFMSFWRMSFQSLKGQFPYFVRTPRARRDVVLDTFVQATWWVAVVAATIARPHDLVVAYWAPVPVYMFIVFFTALPEHYGCEEGSNGWRNTRTIISNPIFRFFFWNGNFHADHHLYPGVPPRNLPKLHSFIGAKLMFVEASYLRFHVALLWDLIGGCQQTKPKVG